MNSGAPEELAVPAPLVAPVVEMNSSYRHIAPLSQEMTGFDGSLLMVLNISLILI
jgi:hypothetical protein